MFLLNSVLILFFLSFCQGKDYCRNDLCPQKNIHIGCTNNGTWGSKCSKDAAVVKIDQSVKDMLVKTHNLLRQKYASGNGKGKRLACKMATMEWDQDLANLAELNVRGCELKHDLCRNTEIYPQSGQNLYMSATSGNVGQQTSGKLLQNAFDAWAREESKIKWADLEKLPPSVGKFGHLTLLINENNSKVGCAIVTSLNNEFRYYYVACNYAANNILDKPVYTKCSQPGIGCANGKSSTYPPLCA